MGRKLLITQILGGLGNQMFQYALAYRIARDFDLDLRLDTSVMDNHSRRTDAANRSFDLGLFALTPQRATKTERWLYNAHGLPMGVRAMCRALAPFTKRRVVTERGFRFEPDLLPLRKPPAYLAGLWQSWKYLIGYEKAIRKEFEFREPLPPSLFEHRDSLRAATSVAIHVRRGDYVSNPVDSATLGFVGEDYYRRAIDVVCHGPVAVNRFFIFSDDLDWCRSNFHWLPASVTFVESSRCESRPAHHIDFQLLAQAKNFIIPNSTFAWWAAWLSTAEQKLIVAPKRWFNDPALDSSDLCPPEWILV